MKNFKYVGSAVAITLMATAPVVAPAIAHDFGITNVKAADTGTQQRLNDDESEMDPDPNVPGSAKYMFTKFKDQFDKVRYVSNASSLAMTLRGMALNQTGGDDDDGNGASFAYFDTNSPQFIYDIQNDNGLVTRGEGVGGIQALKDSKKLQPLGYFEDRTDPDHPKYYYRDIGGYMTVEYTEDGEPKTAKLNTRQQIFDFCTQLDGKVLRDPNNNFDDYENDGNARSDMMDNLDDATPASDGKGVLTTDSTNNFGEDTDTEVSSISLPITITMHLVNSNEASNSKVIDSIGGADGGRDGTNTLTRFSFSLDPSSMEITTGSTSDNFSVGSKIANAKGNNDKLDITDNFTYENKDSDAVKNMETPIYGQSLFTSDDTGKANAFKYAEDDSFDPTSQSATGSDTKALSNGNIVTPGTYYQTVSYNIGSGNDTAIYYMINQETDPAIGSKVSYYATTINNDSATVNPDSKYDIGTNYVVNKKTGMLTVVREIKVSDPVPAKVNADSSITVDSGTKADYTKLDVSKDTLSTTADTDSKTIDLADGYPKVGKYYTDNPLTNSAASSVDENTALNSSDKDYYREITFKLANDVDVSSYTFGDSNVKVDSDAQTITYFQKVHVNKKADPVKTKTAVTLNDATAKVGQDTTGLDKDADAKLTTADGKTTIASGDQVSVGSDFFDSLDDAKANTKTANYTNGKFTKAGSYYQLVSFKLNQADIETYDFNSDPNYVKTDGNTVIFARKITVSTPSSSGSNSSSNSNDENWTINYQSGTAKTKDDQDNYNITNDDNKVIDGTTIPKNTTLNIDRARIDQNGNVQYHIADGEWINANYVTFTAKSDGDDDWTYYKDPGYVVTFDKQDYYSLNNRENSLVTNRALAEKSAWVSDQYRTNKNGVKQYRVATNEWIDSHDVIFVKAMKRIVNVDQTKSYYSLYNIEEHLITNRALDHKTSWYTDATAEDADGNIYYRVASNEWVKQVDGVHVDSSAWY